jgi:hypothetical protein
MGGTKIDMGLDTTLYLNVKKLDTKNMTEDEKWENSDFRAFVLTPNWNDRISDLTPDAYYIGDSMQEGVHYAYSNHSRFRQAIADVAYSGNNWQNVKPPEPFGYFLDFADNEGCISWTTCGKLADDFKEWHVAFVNYWIGKDNGDWWVRVYNQWWEHFATCADEKGVIVYH